MNISILIMSFLVLGKPEGGKSKSKSGDKPEGGTYIYINAYQKYIFKCIFLNKLCLFLY